MSTPATTTPRRIQRRRTPGWRMPEGAIYVGRPTKWGNPFRYRHYTGLARIPAALGGGPWEYEGRISGDGASHDYHHPDGRVTRCHVRYMTPAELVESYRATLLDPTPSMVAAYPSRRGHFLAVTVADIRRELAGRDLVCYCPLSQPCHADVLLELANL